MLQRKRQEDPENYSNCSVMLDGMSIRKHLDWDSKKAQMVGYVDLGAGALKEEAKEAIVFLVVVLRGYWKVPLAYYMINGILGELQSQIVLSAVAGLHEIDIQCRTVVMDSHATNVKMAEILGCSVRPDCIKSFFSHPDSGHQIYVFFTLAIYSRTLEVP